MNYKMVFNQKKDEEVILSTLWIFVTFNYLYCDLLGVMDSNLLKQYLTGTVEGMTINEGFLLGAAILMEIPIAMILLSRILSYRTNRWVNMIASLIKILVMITTLFIGSPTIYYLFFASIEITATLYIFWYAWSWTKKPLIDNYSIY